MPSGLRICTSVSTERMVYDACVVSAVVMRRTRLRLQANGLVTLVECEKCWCQRTVQFRCRHATIYSTLLDPSIVK